MAKKNAPETVTLRVVSMEDAKALVKANGAAILFRNPAKFADDPTRDVYVAVPPESFAYLFYFGSVHMPMLSGIESPILPSTETRKK